MTLSKKQRSEIFLLKSKRIHGNKFDYSLVDYIDSSTKVIIICPTHGKFLKQPSKHTGKSAEGCQKCGFERIRTSKANSTNSFIIKAKSVHGDKNNYSKVKYVNSSTAVIIICRQHGEYMQNPSSHIAGNLGCVQCSSLKKSEHHTQSSDWFIPAANKVHNSKFDYSKFIYINKKTKSTVICHEHGEFNIDPYHHVIRKQGCRECSLITIGRAKADNKESFVLKALKIHGGKYNYENTLYSGTLKTVIISCSKHGDFPITPSSHLQGGGCKKCANEKRSISQSKGLDEFIKDAHKKHGNKFDYSKFKYINSHTRGIIICRKHNSSFKQSPGNHLKGQSSCNSCLNGTLEEFIETANSTHNNTYDYSKFEFINHSTKGIIICPKHGEFEQKPYLHTKGVRGCKACSTDKQRKSLSTFVKQAKVVHNSFYSYENSVYIRAKTPLLITCSKHGQFSSSPDNHLKGKGCRKCAFENATKSTNQFIQDSKTIHGNKYDYSKVKYKHSLTEVTIICPIHGEFNKKPSAHIQGVGCNRCSKSHQYTTEEWIVAAMERHKNKYDYSKAIFTGSSKPITIICSVHGEFNPHAASHLSAGSGCPKCASMTFGKVQGEARFKSTGQFKVESILLHGKAMYNYSKSIYTGADKKLIITCPIHGDFYKTPTKHIHGLQGCQTCSYLRGYNKNSAGCLYILESNCGSLLKIGISNNLLQRAKDLRRNDKFNDFKIIQSYWHDDGVVALKLEGEAHKFGDSLNLRGFKQSELAHLFTDSFDGYTEWFKKDKRMIQFIETEFKKVES